MPFINRYARNPIYAGSLRLDDVVPRTEYVIIDLCCLYIQIGRIGSKWRIVSDGTKWPKCGYALVANEDNGMSLDLCEVGIYPHPDGSWNEHRFAIHATDNKKITDLYLWLKQQQHTRVAEKLAEEFLHLTNILDEDFWRKVDGHLGLCVS